MIGVARIESYAVVAVDGKAVAGGVAEYDVDLGVVFCCKDNKGPSIGIGPGLHDVFGLEGMGGDDGGGTAVGTEGIEMDIGTVCGGDVDAFAEDGVGRIGVDVVGGQCEGCDGIMEGVAPIDIIADVVGIDFSRFNGTAFEWKGEEVLAKGEDGGTCVI